MPNPLWLVSSTKAPFKALWGLKSDYVSLPKKSVEIHHVKLFVLSKDSLTECRMTWVLKWNKWVRACSLSDAYNCCKQVSLITRIRLMDRNHWKCRTLNPTLQYPRSTIHQKPNVEFKTSPYQSVQISMWHKVSTRRYINVET